MLDTVFVTGEGIRHDHDSWSRMLTDLPETYVDVTMLATYAWGPGAELRFYSGATPAGPRTGMFSAQLTSTTIPATERKPPGPVEPRPPARRPGHQAPPNP